jgi:hypothetical protein
VPEQAPSIRRGVGSAGRVRGDARIDEAREWLARELKLHPGLTIAGVKAVYAKAFAPELLATFVEGYRKAGLPEE